MGEMGIKESWNKKRIITAVFLLGVLLAGGYFLKTDFFTDKSQNAEEVKGITVEEKIVTPESKINIQEAAVEKINNLKQEVSDLDVVEIATSSPQIQKVLNDISSLKQYPSTQAKELCKKLIETACGL